MRSKKNFLQLFETCELCPKKCGINRMNGLVGFCCESHVLKIAHMGAHFGEEPPITGNQGSGTIFFTGCSLKCSFCQNYQISRNGLGNVVSIEKFISSVIDMIDHDNVQNINFVTPDHFFPYTFLLVEHLREKKYPIPIVYNLSGYQSLKMLRITEDYADIYLPDYKYSGKGEAGLLRVLQ